MTMTIRYRKQTDLPKLIEIFEQSILAIDESVYSKAQKRAWATVETGLALPETFWCERFTRTQPLVAVNESGDVLGFIEYLTYKNQLGEYDPLSGYIEGLFVHPDYQRRGVAQALYDEGVDNRLDIGMKNIWVHASKLAYAFFLKQGFNVIEEQAIKRHNVILERYLMCKRA